jgi:hypothetical protein
MWVFIIVEIYCQILLVRILFWKNWVSWLYVSNVEFSGGSRATREFDFVYQDQVRASFFFLCSLFWTGHGLQCWTADRCLARSWAEVSEGNPSQLPQLHYMCHVCSNVCWLARSPTWCPIQKKPWSSLHFPKWACIHCTAAPRQHE